MKAAIAPRRVGAATLGMTSDVVQAALGEPGVTRKSEGMTFLDYDGLVVTLHDGSVNMLIVESPAIGSTPLGVVVGMSARDAQHRIGLLAYDDEEGLWTTGETPGLWYEIARPPREDEEPLDPPLVAEQYEISDTKNAVVRRIYVM